jgi:hypothetical protein
MMVNLCQVSLEQALFGILRFFMVIKNLRLEIFNPMILDLRKNLEQHFELIDSLDKV